MDESLSGSGLMLQSEAKTTGRCQLLELPAELRTKIFMYVLPRTMNHCLHGPCWTKGTTALLRTSKMVHNEAVLLMYSQATFLLGVVWDITFFECRSISRIGGVSRENHPFPQCFTKDHLQQIKRFKVMVYCADNHIHWLKESETSRRGLTLGIRDQLEGLYKVLESVPRILELVFQFSESFTVTKLDETVLRPIIDLENVQLVKFTQRGISDHIRQQLQPSVSLQ